MAIVFVVARRGALDRSRRPRPDLGRGRQLGRRPQLHHEPASRSISAPRSWQWNFEHPPVMKYLDGIGAQFADGFGPARALSAIWIALGCALLVPIGARLFSLRVGVLAGAIAALLPPLVAHGQIVGHESPTVLWWSLGILLALGVHDDAPRSPHAARSGSRRIGVVIGIAIASRFVNGLLGPLCAVIVVDRRRRRAWRRATLRVGRVAACRSSRSSTLYVVWPRLWLHPIAALAESFAQARQRARAPSRSSARSRTTRGPHYFVVYLVATLPLGVLARRGRVARARRSRARDRARADRRRVARDPARRRAVAGAPGRRALRDAVPARARADRRRRASISSRRGLALAPRVRRRSPSRSLRVPRRHARRASTRTTSTTSASRSAAPAPSRAHGWFETAWWGEGVDRAVDYVNEHAAPGAHVYRDCIEPKHLAWFREDLWTPMTASPTEATWIVSYAPASHRCPSPPDARPVFEVTARRPRARDRVPAPRAGRAIARGPTAVHRVNQCCDARPRR